MADGNKVSCSLGWQGSSANGPYTGENAHGAACRWGEGWLGRFGVGIRRTATERELRDMGRGGV